MKSYQTVERSVVIAPATGVAALTSAEIDTKDADYVTVELALSARADAAAEPVVVAVQESDTTGSGFAAITDLGKSIPLTAAAQLAVFHVNLNGTRKRFLRVVATPGTDATDDVVTMAGIANVKRDSFPADIEDAADIVVAV